MRFHLYAQHTQLRNQDDEVNLAVWLRSVSGNIKRMKDCPVRCPMVTLKLLEKEFLTRWDI
ncbi:hypothetical protein GGP56_003424 [Salinibacter ruber]|nr:hypothetical protein [Salinibacter ruber]